MRLREAARSLLAREAGIWAWARRQDRSRHGASGASQPPSQLRWAGSAGEAETGPR